MEKRISVTTISSFPGVSLGLLLGLTKSDDIEKIQGDHRIISILMHPYAQLSTVASKYLTSLELQG